MSNVSYHEQVHSCEQNFNNLGQVYHFYSAESFPAFLLDKEDFNMAMNIFGLTSGLYRETVRILTFQLMSNHIHIIACGTAENIDEMIRLFAHLMQRGFESRNKVVDLSKLSFSRSEITSLDYARKCIAYVNRNGYLIDQDYMPTTYPWGANRFYFNKEIAQFHKDIGRALKQHERRSLSKSRRFDNLQGLMMLGSHITPVSYCDITSGESLFRNARHYNIMISRNIEAYAEISAQIGETTCLTDYELFSAVRRILRSEYGNAEISTLDIDSRIGLAKMMRYDYNASNKQICRILNIPKNVVDAMFGCQHA